MISSFILFSISLGISFSTDEDKRFINELTSFFGLLQFSLEKAYKVNCLTPSSREISIDSLTDFIPELCPKNLSLLIFFAHLPFPSIIIAMWLGIKRESIFFFSILWAVTFIISKNICQR